MTHPPQKPQDNTSSRTAFAASNGTTGEPQEKLTRVDEGQREPTEDRAELEQIKEEVHQISPEGLPPDVELRGPSWVTMWAVCTALVVLTAVGVAFAVNLRAGAVALIVGLVLVVLVNPTVWVAMMRDKEQRRVIKHRQRSVVIDKDSARRESERSTQQ